MKAVDEYIHSRSGSAIKRLPSQLPKLKILSISGAPVPACHAGAPALQPRERHERLEAMRRTHPPDRLEQSRLIWRGSLSRRDTRRQTPAPGADQGAH